jgi:hypothetical protein
MEEASKRSFWTTVPGVLAGVAALITAIGGLYAVIRERQPSEPSQSGASLPTASVAKALWQKNWLTISQPRGSLGSAGQVWTNRDQLLSMLRALNIPEGDPLRAVREQLLTLAIATPEDRSNGPYWSLPYSSQMRHLEDELKRGIRDRAIDHGVTIDSSR